MQFLPSIILAAVILGTSLFTSFSAQVPPQYSIEVASCDPQVRRCD